MNENNHMNFAQEIPGIIKYAAGPEHLLISSHFSLQYGIRLTKVAPAHYMRELEQVFPILAEAEIFIKISHLLVL